CRTRPCSPSDRPSRFHPAGGCSRTYLPDTLIRTRYEAAWVARLPAGRFSLDRPGGARDDSSAVTARYVSWSKARPGRAPAAEPSPSGESGCISPLERTIAHALPAGSSGDLRTVALAAQHT